MVIYSGFFLKLGFSNKSDCDFVSMSLKPAFVLCVSSNMALYRFGLLLVMSLDRPVNRID
jgi:hypothetical protein